MPKVEEGPLALIRFYEARLGRSALLWQTRVCLEIVLRQQADWRGSSDNSVMMNLQHSPGIARPLVLMAKYESPRASVANAP